MTHNPHLAYTQKFPTQLENATQPRLSSRTFAFHSRRTTCPQNPYWLHLTLNVQIPSYRSNSTYKVSNWLDFTTWMKTSILNLPFNRERKKGRKNEFLMSWQLYDKNDSLNFNKGENNPCWCFHLGKWILLNCLLCKWNRTNTLEFWAFDVRWSRYGFCGQTFLQARKTTVLSSDGIEQRFQTK